MCIRDRRERETTVAEDEDEEEEEDDSGTMDEFLDFREWSRHEGDEVGEEGAIWDTDTERTAWLQDMDDAKSFASAEYCIFAFLSQL